MTDRWLRRFVALAELVAGWSKDPSSMVGCVIVDVHNRVIGLGYNGFPRGVVDSKARYDDRASKYQLIVHAEVNAILNANTSVVGCDLVTLMYPCANCAKTIVQAGIVAVYTPRPLERKPWSDEVRWSRCMLEEAGVKVVYY